MLSDLRELAGIGRFKTGVDRVALSPADLEARRWLMRRMQEAGLEPHMDEVANVYGRDPNAARTLLIGSHTDTVPQGGWLDGAMGVIYALEIARAAKERGASSPLGIDVMSFQDEEGTYLAFLGSRTFCNNLTNPEIDAAKSGEVRLRTVLANVEPVANPHRLDPARHLCYLEAHIEQGPRLEQARRRIGVVTGVVGIRRFRIHTRGQADHAGTTPMSHRRDAGAALMRLAAQVAQEFPRLGSAETVWNIGSIILRPGRAQRRAERGRDGARIPRYRSRHSRCAGEPRAPLGRSIGQRRLCGRDGADGLDCSDAIGKGARFRAGRLQQGNGRGAHAHPKRRRP